MIRTIRTSCAIALLSLTAVAADAAAQLSIAAGPTRAIGNLSDAVELGYHVQGSFGLSLPLIPIAGRIDAAFNQFPSKGVDGNFRILSGSVNAVLSIPSLGVTPYLIGGIGMYSQNMDDDIDNNDNSSTEVGANAGVGVRVGLPGLAVFAEARLHNLFNEGDATRFVPLSLGIRF